MKQVIVGIVGRKVMVQEHCPQHGCRALYVLSASEARAEGLSLWRATAAELEEDGLTVRTARHLAAALLESARTLRRVAT